MNAPVDLSEFGEILAENNQSTPFAQQHVILSRQDHIQLISEKNQYKSLFERGKLRIAELEQAVDDEKAKNRDLTQRLYGKKTEKSTTKADLKAHANKDFVGPLLPPKRGAKPKRKNRKRQSYPDLPVQEETLSLTAEQSCCSSCGKAYAPFPKTETSQILEIEVKAHIRRIHRQMGKATCHCPEAKPLVTAPVAPRLYPKASLGVSVWTLVLLDKYQSYTPSNRLYQRLRDQGAPLSAGTITNGLQKIAPLFQPIHQAMLVQQRQERIFHNDETGWKVFEAVDGKVGYKWYLWVTRSPSVITFTMATGRSTHVLEDCFAEHPIEKMIIICDRYSAYKKFAKNKEHVILAFCWAHVRRDFLDAAKRHPDDEDWMFQWIDGIGELYHLNHQRLEHWDQNIELSNQSSAFTEKHEQLVQTINDFKVKADESRKIEAPKKGALKTDRFKVLNSLNNHWEGLKVFVDYPQVAMDNNSAEQALRMPVVGRRGFYGSGSIWSAELAAILMGLIKTLMTLWSLNPHTWMRTYLQACADNASAAPTDLSRFLPWMMTDKQKAYFSRPYPHSPSTSNAEVNSPEDVEIQDSS